MEATIGLGRWSLGVMFAAVLALSGVLPGLAEAQTAAAVAPSPAPSGAARIWFYSDYEPYGARSYAPVSLNGAHAGYVRPDGSAFYRDVAPGRYFIAVESTGIDVNQNKTVDLAPGQQLYVKILNSSTWDVGGDISMYRHDTFYVSLVPEQIARAELPAHRLTGG